LKNHYVDLLLGTLLAAGWGLLACGGSGRHNAQSCPPLGATTSSSGSLASVVDPLVANEMKAQGLPGAAVAIAKNGTILYTQGYGYADLATCQPVQPSMDFQIGSVTKQFTAAAVLQLQNAGKVNIDDPVVAYLPSYAFDARITLRMLLTQTSGLQNYLDFPDVSSWINGVSEPTVLTQIAQAPLIFTPGTYYAYSNSNYFVLGSVIEAVSSVTYPSYMASNIFQPVGLSHTSYLEPADSASPYTQGPNPGIIPDPSLFFSAGALWSNVQDLATWDAALLNGKVMPAALFALMVTPSGLPMYPQGGASPYAMGLVRDTQVGHPLAWHNGETVAYTSFNGMFLDDGFSVIVLTNMPVKEGTPLLNLERQLMQGICTSSATAGNC
jgi:D-alanyl-D-alanine carboxypeptidase